MKQVHDAARGLNAFYLVWRDWGFLPEEYDFVHWQLSGGKGAWIYPLRPELIESMFHQSRSVARDPCTLLLLACRFMVDGVRVC